MRCRRPSIAPLAIEGLSSVTLLDEPRLLALPLDHALAARDSISAQELSGLPWLRVPASDGPWTAFWFRAASEGLVGPRYGRPTSG